MSPEGRERLYSATGFRSFDDDRERHRVEAAFRLVGVPYGDPFTCVSIYPCGANPHADSNRYSGDPPVILKPEVLDKLVIAGAGDIQNIAGWGPARIRSALLDLRNLSREEKQAALLQLLEQRPDANPIEARIFDYEREDDVAEDRYRRDFL